MLGVGNIIFGLRGEKDYYNLLSEVSADGARVQESPGSEKPNINALPFVHRSEERQRLLAEAKARYDFYSFALSGGLFFTVVGLVLLFIAFQRSRRHRSEV